MMVVRTLLGSARMHVEVAGKERLVTVEPVDVGGSLFAVTWDGVRRVVDVARLRPGALSLIIPASGHSIYSVSCHETAPGELALTVASRCVHARISDGRGRRVADVACVGDEHLVPAPMSGSVIRVLVESGDRVVSGQSLVVVEAMKMENEVTSPVTGVVGVVNTAEGDTVETGEVILVVSNKSHD